MEANQIIVPVLNSLESTDNNWTDTLDKLGYGVWEYNLADNKISFSDKWHQMFGYTPGEVPNDIEEWASHVHEHDAVSAAAAFSKYLNGESSEYITEFRIRCKDGKYKWVLSRGFISSKTVSGKPKSVVGTHVDIHERKMAEEAQKISADTFTSAFKYSGVGKALVSPAGRWLDANDALCAMLGYTKEELLQRSFQDVTYEADLEADMKLVRQMLAKEIDTYQLEKRYVSKQGKIVWVLITVSLVWNIDNTPKFFIVQIADITHNKQLIDELNIANTELEATKLNLINRLEKLEELNHIIAHNLRGPAKNIHFLADALHKGSSAFKPEEVIEMIKEGSRALVESLETLMDLTQIRLNKTVPYDDCDIEDIANSILSQLHAVIFEKRVVVQLFLQAPKVSYPKAYLESILYNLLSNAIKYSRNDIAPHITITSFEEAGKVVLTIKDNGIGIDLDKYADKIFTLNQVFHEGYDSKGVGLFITKTQIESLGGTITVNSKVNEGSEFTVVL